MVQASKTAGNGKYDKGSVIGEVGLLKCPYVADAGTKEFAAGLTSTNLEVF
jgi:hypothetical protein